MWRPTETMYVCRFHFDPKHILTGPQGLTRLHPDGYPTLLNGKELDAMKIMEIEIGKEDNVEVLEMKAKDDKISELNDSLTLKEQELVQLRQTLGHVRYELNQTKLKLKRTVESTARKLNEKDEEIKRRKLSNDEVISYLDERVESKELVALVKRTIDSKTTVAFPDVLRSFAYTLHYYSSRGYDFVRNSFQKFLPHSKTFNAWTRHIQIKPGFIDESFLYLKEVCEQSDRKLYFALLVDEIHIRKQFIHKDDGFVGFVDYGEILDVEPGNKEKVAASALFVYANCVNSSQKIPLGYCLTNGLKAAVLVEILKNFLRRMNDASGNVLSITFDGLQSNRSAAELLGANMNVNSDEFKPSFLDPTSGNTINVIFDVCHMMKLFRNLFKSYGKIRNFRGEEINWIHIHSLHVLQQTEGLKAANKLSMRHVDFELQKMKTKLCLQIMSRSVSVALAFGRELEIQGFEKTHATEEFILLMNRLFDILNSRSYSKGDKAAVTTERVKQIAPFLAFMKFYLLTLDVNERGNWVRLVDSHKKTAARGLVVAITSYENIVSQTICKDDKFRFLSFYEFSQDHLEQFFSLVRSQSGFNNNPNVVQLSNAVKGIICMKTRNRDNGNCTVFDENYTTRICAFKNINSLMDESSGPGTEANEGFSEEENDQVLEDLSPYLENVVAYISGFVSRTLTRKLTCAYCISSLIANNVEFPDIEKDFVLIKMKDNGGLVYPSKFVLNVCKRAEQFTKANSERGIQSLKKSELVNSICCEFSVDVDIGWRQSENSCSHCSNLVEMIANEYTKVRLHHEAKQASLQMNPKTNRNVCTKLYLFKGN